MIGLYMNPPRFGNRHFTSLTAQEKAGADYVIFDLDNCLFDDEWRLPLIDWTQTDIDARYDRYHWAGVLDESPKAPLVRQWAQTHVPIFLTARPVKYREQTARRIMEVFGIVCYVLQMRNNGDNRPSRLLKQEMVVQLAEYGVPVYKIDHAYDDHPEVCEMYHERFKFNVTRMAIHEKCAMTPPESSRHQTLTVKIDASEAQAVVDEAMKELRSTGEFEPVVATLAAMSGTYRERNAVYKDNYKTAGAMLHAMYSGLNPPHRPADCPRHFEVDHLLWLIIVKLSRFAHSDSTHVDSMLDIGVYAAMIATILQEKSE